MTWCWNGDQTGAGAGPVSQLMNVKGICILFTPGQAHIVALILSFDWIWLSNKLSWIGYYTYIQGYVMSKTLRTHLVEQLCLSQLFFFAHTTCNFPRTDNMVPWILPRSLGCEATMRFAERTFLWLCIKIGYSFGVGVPVILLGHADQFLFSVPFPLGPPDVRSCSTPHLRHTQVPNDDGDVIPLGVFQWWEFEWCVLEFNNSCCYFIISSIILQRPSVPSPPARARHCTSSYDGEEVQYQRRKCINQYFKKILAAIWEYE